MNRLLPVLAGLLLLANTARAQIIVGTPPAPPLPVVSEEEMQQLAPYMTKDFTLTSPLEVRNELTGFGTFFGTIWRVESDGSWTITRIYRKELFLIGKGQLAKPQILDLARKLVLFDPLTLPGVSGLAPFVNPHEVRVFFGGVAAVHVLGVDQKFAPVTAETLIASGPLAAYTMAAAAQTGKAVPIPLPSVPARFAGIETALRGMIQPNLGVQLDLPVRLQQMGHP